MFNGALVESVADRLPSCGERVNILSLKRRHMLPFARGAALLALALLAGCETKPKLPPGVHPSVEVGPPLKSETWKGVATAADQDRLARLGLAWQEALAEAKKTNPADVAKRASCCCRVRRCRGPRRRPAATIAA